MATIASQLIAFLNGLTFPRVKEGGIEWRIPGEVRFVIGPDNATWDHIYTELSWSESYAKINGSDVDLNDLIIEAAIEAGVLESKDGDWDEDAEITEKGWALVIEQVIQKIRNL